MWSFLRRGITQSNVICQRDNGISFLIRDFRKMDLQSSRVPRARNPSVEPTAEKPFYHSHTYEREGRDSSYARKSNATKFLYDGDEVHDGLIIWTDTPLLLSASFSLFSRRRLPRPR